MLRYFLVLSFFCCLPGYAEVLIIERAKINKTLEDSFPIVQFHKDLRVTFSDPLIRLNMKRQSISILTNIVIEQKGKFMHAKGGLLGVVKFCTELNQICMERPMLQEFEITENRLASSKMAIREVNQIVGRNMPSIILVNAKNAHQEIPLSRLTKVDVVESGMRLDF